MRTIVLDKIASVTLNCAIAREARLGDELPCREGDVLAVRILNRKSTYNTLELTTGRFSQLKPGDIIAGALGHRRALNGYAGHLPDALRVGERVDLLNLGGVLGCCDAIHPDLGPPFSCEVIGQVLHFPYLGERIGVPANIAHGAPPLAETVDVRGVPVVAIVGTCMNAGKTAAANALIQELVRARLTVHAAKATGVSLRRDILSMEDSGARRCMTFTDLGVVTTTRRSAPGVARTLLSTLSAPSPTSPDAIVLELGDGLLGDYGVDAILSDAAMRDALTAVVLAANDPVGAWGGCLRLREEHGIEVTAVTGPATDNAAGSDRIRELLGVPAVNARVEPTGLAEVVLSKIDEVRHER